MWDERFAPDDYVYGTQPNAWLVAQAGRFAPGGRILSLGEGEGRNAVWLAERGFFVDAVDASRVGLSKAERLARSRAVRIRTIHADLADFTPAAGAYDGLVIIFVHLPPEVRAEAHRRAALALKPGGVVVVEAFTPKQLTLDSGGPRKPGLLYTAGMLRQDFPFIRWEKLEELEIDLAEGTLLRGRAAVVRGVGVR